MSPSARRPATRIVLGTLVFLGVLGVCVGGITGLAYVGMSYLRLASGWGGIALAAVVFVALVALVYAVLSAVEDR